ncbi:MAG TPA: hypothetical protein DIC56_13365 [Rhizobium sp.]|nr:hypothetical protein [Rhizobium sp.]
MLRRRALYGPTVFQMQQGNDGFGKKKYRAVRQPEERPRFLLRHHKSTMLTTDQGRRLPRRATGRTTLASAGHMSVRCNTLAETIDD